MLGDDETRQDDIDLLEAVDEVAVASEFAAAMGTAAERVRHDFMDLEFVEEIAKVGLVARLAADRTFLLTVGHGRPLVRLDDVGRRRLGRVAGVLACGGQLLLQPSNLRVLGHTPGTRRLLWFAHSSEANITESKM